MLTLTGCSGDARSSPVETGLVAFVADGDTLRLAGGRSVRLVQIDAPEAVAECFGRESARALATLAPPGTKLELERDPRLDARDRFGRLLRYVHADGQNLNVRLVERGAAAPYFFRGSRGRYADNLLAAAEAARSKRRGLWGSCPLATLAPGLALDAGPSRPR